MLKNNGAVEDSPYFSSDSTFTENINHLVSVNKSVASLHFIKMFDVVDKKLGTTPTTPENEAKL